VIRGLNVRRLRCVALKSGVAVFLTGVDFERAARQGNHPIAHRVARSADESRVILPWRISLTGGRWRASAVPDATGEVVLSTNQLANAQKCPEESPQRE